MRRIFNLEMSESTALANYLNEFAMITMQLSTIEIDFDYEVQALILLSSLPESWSGAITTVNASTGKGEDEV